MSTLPDIADLIGVPFLDGGRDSSRGLDCWGLVMEIYRRMGIAIPDYGRTVPSAYASAECDRAARGAVVSDGWTRIKTPACADIVAMHTDARIPGVINHFGVCLGGGRFVHTIRARNAHVARLSSIEWQHRIVGYYRWQSK